MRFFRDQTSNEALRIDFSRYLYQHAILYCQSPTHAKFLLVKIQQLALEGGVVTLDCSWAYSKVAHLGKYYIFNALSAINLKVLRMMLFWRRLV